MKSFIEADLEIIILNSVDIVTTSDPGNVDGSGDMGDLFA